jgi:hypothetical protein
MGLKKAKYVIKSCKECPYYRKERQSTFEDRQLHVYYDHYCKGQCVDRSELKKKWFLNKDRCILICGDEGQNVPNCENNV